jgi:hypothetical protein
VPGEHSPEDIVATDLNGDGLPDILLTYPYQNELGILLTRRCMDDE